MQIDRHKSQRHAISRFAKIRLPEGTLTRNCLIINLSRGGVRLHVEGAEVPERFVLLISDGDHATPRACKVSWRLGFELGAEFLDGAGNVG
jgi:PilZ domain